MSDMINEFNSIIDELTEYRLGLTKLINNVKFQENSSKRCCNATHSWIHSCRDDDRASHSWCDFDRSITGFQKPYPDIKHKLIFQNDIKPAGYKYLLQRKLNFNNCSFLFL